MLAEETRDDVVGGRADRGDGDATDLSEPGTPNQVDHALRLGDQATSLGEEEIACRREAYLSARALEEADAELLLERLDLLAQSGLGHVQSLRRSAEVQLLGDGDEVADEAELGRIHKLEQSIRTNNLFA